MRSVRFNGTALLVSLGLVFAPVFLEAPFAKPPKAADKNLADTEIRLAVEHQLIMDSAVPAHLVDVEVKEGIAMLSGSVDTLLAKERATQLAQAIRGVHSVTNTIEVKASKRSEADLKNEIQRALAADPATDLYETGVQVSNGAVILTGTVDSLAERELAGDVAKSVRGVRAIKNDIVIKPKVERPESEVLADVRALLKKDPWVDAESVKVEFKDGTVYLSGTVRSAIERTYAINDAWVPGVIQVDVSQLAVEPGFRAAKMERVDDQEAERLIERAFRLHPRLSSFKVDVMSEGPIVTLLGIVDNFEAKNEAAEIARNTTGVMQVRNLIKVRPEKIPDDAALAKAVREALLRDAYVSRYEMNVRARNGMVYLEGRVDSSFEKTYAESVAGRVQGVADVKNNLRIVNLEIPQKTDWELRHDIADAIRWNPFVSEDRIEVSVENGIATLKGNVDSWQERIAATRVAQRAGAESVLNQLEVAGTTAQRRSSSALNHKMGSQSES